EGTPGLDADAAVFARAVEAPVDRARVPVVALDVAATVLAGRRDTGEGACDERVALHLALTCPRKSLRPHLLTDERRDAATVLGDGSAAPARRGKPSLDRGYRRRVAGLRAASRGSPNCSTQENRESRDDATGLSHDEPPAHGTGFWRPVLVHGIAGVKAGWRQFPCGR